MYHARQIERHAIAAFVHYGVRLNIPLSRAAARELARIRRSRAGLAEVQAAQAAHRMPFESNADYGARLLQLRTAVRAAVQHSEVA